MLVVRTSAFCHLLPALFVACFGMHFTAGAQTITVPLNDLSFFKAPSKSWMIAGDVSGDLSKANALTGSQGTGVLVNLPVKNNGADLYTNAEYGDVDLELEYMMAKGSNSGIYLQGRYEVQLMDSWGVQNPKAGDNGGIYQRWDESRGKGMEGYEGHAPRQNATKAPGLWQRLKISFQAPRFDAAGKKIENAKMLRIELNGVAIHENVELTGPTRGAMENNERAQGPLRIQGDHGAIAFRNIKITPFGKQRPDLQNISYKLYKGNYTDTTNIGKLPPEAKGPLGGLTVSAINNIPEQFFISYSGTMVIKEPGDYSFNLYVPGGRGILKINDQEISAQGRGSRGRINLQAGSFPFELLYTKYQDWTNRSIAMSISGPGIREYIIGDAIIGGGNADPIMVEAPVNTMLRSFVDIPGGKRIVHAISVGSPQQVHYTYDLDKGWLLQAWRGAFLDATPMWYSRGDGSSRPRGAVQFFGNPMLTLGLLASADAVWKADTAGSNYTTKGYRLDKADFPTFLYTVYGSNVEDAIKPLENGQGLKRELTVHNASNNLYARLGAGSTIEVVGNGLYTVDGRAYYVQIDDAGGAKPIVRNSNGGKELIIPVQNKLSYSILF